MVTMKLSLITLALLPLVAVAGVPKVKIEEEEEGQNWFVLVAGSNTYSNYRHQSDVCHAYQIMHGQGVPDDHIIVMMYDDIAHNFRNPFPGEIFNHPNGSDVYAGVPKDYVGRDITVENFFKVLQGDVEGLKGIGSGKAVQSGPNDRIFINLVDHGAPGIFAFPHEHMTANELYVVIKGMHELGKYKELLLYMESCESGSMFEDYYPDNINFYGLSASNPYESSWACYCNSKAHSCLGDLFSCNWMEDTDANDPETETLNEQFENTKRLTTESEVMQWGDLSMDQQTVATFFSATSSSSKTSRNTRNNDLGQSKGTAIKSQDVPLFMLESELKSAKNDVEKESLRQQIVSLLQKREFVTATMKKIAFSVTGDKKVAENMMKDKHSKITNWDCYGPAVRSFSDNCFNVGQSTYALTVLHTLLDLCEAGYNGSNINSAITDVCTFPTVYDAV